MMTEAPDMNPAMTEWLRKLVSQPSLNRPTKVYMQPARNATCHAQQPSQARAPHASSNSCTPRCSGLLQQLCNNAKKPNPLQIVLEAHSEAQGQLLSCNVPRVAPKRAPLRHHKAQQ